ncbi:MAG TPA: hypothetical protein VFS43_33590 [Polyangiaceae bacterium]|nr:hypothetical protein [Polyangiaceae bacterium]
MPDDAIEVQCEVTIARPVEEVRAHYRDVEHHVRGNVHPDAPWSFETPTAAGESRVRIRFRLFGRAQSDVVTFEEGPGGAFVMNYVEGANEGVRVVHTFHKAGAKSTRVEVVARAPATAGRKLFGPVFTLGLKRILERACDDNKRDLEGGTYRPGRVRGNLAAALETLGAAVETVAAYGDKGAPIAQAILSAACLVAVSDGDVSDGERAALHAIADKLHAPGTGPAWVDQKLAELLPLAGTDEHRQLARASCLPLRNVCLGTDAVAAAAIIALISQGVDLTELDALGDIASGADVTDETIRHVVDDVERALSAT